MVAAVKTGRMAPVTDPPFTASNRRESYQAPEKSEDRDRSVNFYPWLNKGLRVNYVVLPVPVEVGVGVKVGSGVWVGRGVVVGSGVLVGSGVGVGCVAVGWRVGAGVGVGSTLQSSVPWQSEHWPAS